MPLAEWGHQTLHRTKDTQELPYGKDAVLLSALIYLLKLMRRKNGRTTILDRSSPGAVLTHLMLPVSVTQVHQCVKWGLIGGFSTQTHLHVFACSMSSLVGSPRWVENVRKIEYL
jgi:hypothetical protein